MSLSLNNPKNSAAFKEDVLSWLRLARTSAIGPKAFFELISIFGSAEVALLNLNDMAKAGGRKQKLEIATIADAQAELDACKKADAAIICAFSEHYPEELASISNPPPIITIKGLVALLGQRKVAIVGARNASANGIAIAKKLTMDLAKHGYKTVSGLARGIDAVVHTASLETGTIGIIAGGIDSIYPKEHKELFHALYEKGLVISEYKIGSSVIPQHFPQRNRIIAGLSLGVVVIEAAKRSGTLITARFAAEQGREVFAVPGSPLDIRSSGTNALIKNGATLIESGEDVIAALEIFSSKLQQNKLQDIISTDYCSMKISKAPSNSELAQYRSKLLDLIPYNAVRIEDLAKYLEIDFDIANFLILELELAGKIARTYGNAVMRLAQIE